MRTIALRYFLKSQIDLIYDESGYLVELKVDGQDRTENGDTEMAVVAAIADAGHDLQMDISQAFERLVSA